MTVSVRRLRGVLGMSVLWTLLWIAVYAVLLGLTAVLDPDSIDDGEGWGLAVIAAAIGATAGHRVRAAADAGPGAGGASASCPRSARRRCGAVASAVFPLLVGKPDQALIMAVVGALLGAGLGVVARRAGRDGPARPVPDRPHAAARRARSLNPAVTGRHAGARCRHRGQRRREAMPRAGSQVPVSGRSCGAGAGAAQAAVCR